MELDFSNAVSSAVNAASLREILTVARTQNADATLRIGPEGSLTLRTRGMDGVTLIDIFANNGFFAGEVPERPVGIEIDRWLDALKTGKGDAVIEWMNGAARITCGNISTVLRLDIPEDLFNMPAHLEFTVSAMLDPAPLKSLMKLIPPKVFSPWTVEVREGGVKISSFEKEGTGSCIEISPEELVVLSVEEPAKAHYPRNNWADLLGALPAGPIGVELKDNFPCKVTFGGDDWSGTWVCAPMILDEYE